MKKMRLTKVHIFSSKFWEIYIKMVHSEHILISISTTQNLYKKSVSLYKGYIDFFQNYPCQQQRFLNVHLNRI